MKFNREEILSKAYKEYKLMPLGIDSELHDKRWCVFTGRSFAPPHPHRHYTIEEFEKELYSNRDFADRFVFNRYSKL